MLLKDCNIYNRLIARSELYGMGLGQGYPYFRCLDHYCKNEACQRSQKLVARKTDVFAFQMLSESLVLRMIREVSQPCQGLAYRGYYSSLHIGCHKYLLNQPVISQHYVECKLENTDLPSVSEFPSSSLNLHISKGIRFNRVTQTSQFSLQFWPCF